MLKQRKTLKKEALKNQGRPVDKEQVRKAHALRRQPFGRYKQTPFRKIAEELGTDLHQAHRLIKNYRIIGRNVVPVNKPV